MADEARNEGYIYPDSMTINADEICTASFIDPDYAEMLSESGTPDKWELDWFREFIDQYSNFYDKWSLNALEEMEPMIPSHTQLIHYNNLNF